MFHFQVKVVSFSCSLTNACENRDTTMDHGDVVDHLHDDNGFTDTGATEHSHFTAADERDEEIKDLNTRLECLGCCFLLDKFGCQPVNRHCFVRLYRTQFINRLTNNV